MTTTPSRLRACLAVLAALTLAAAGCDPESARSGDPGDRPAAAKQATPAAGEAKPKDNGPDPTKDEVKRKEVGKNIFLETRGKKRRVLVSGSVVLNKGPLELFLTRKDTKEHEAVVAADIDAIQLKAALLATGAREGEPVRFEPKYQPASGQKIKVTVLYEAKGKTVSVPAQEWVRNVNTRKTLGVEWVFAGSRLIKNPLDEGGKPIFLANDGDIVCVSNFESALLDLPIKSSKDMADLVFEANTEKIPAVGTKVTVVFEPITEKKGK
jgi:hypothetical protein